MDKASKGSGLSLSTIRRMEDGNPNVSLEHYLKYMFNLGQIRAFDGLTNGIRPALLSAESAGRNWRKYTKFDAELESMEHL